MTYKINNISPTQCQTALKLFFGIAEEWRLTNEQCCALLGIKSESTMRSWHKRVQANEDISLSTDTIERLSLIAGIYKGIQKIFDDPDQWRSQEQVAAWRPAWRAHRGWWCARRQRRFDRFVRYLCIRCRSLRTNTESTAAVGESSNQGQKVSGPSQKIVCT